jgi:uncharacterized membrane protein YdjX (TVP38/TMEM64 family)
MNDPDRSQRLHWAAAAVVLALLAWQGHHLAHRLPRFEQAIEGLGPWGPIAFCAAVLVLEPLLVPDTLFALAAGAAFGPIAGTVYYGGAVYLACLGLQWLGGRWLKAPVLRQLEKSERIQTLVRNATRGGTRPVFFVRLVPVSPALLSYALGAAGVPLRSALVGNLGMFVHMLPTLYFGAAAVHVTRMAGTHHTQWERDGVLGMLGLGLCALVAMQITRRVRARTLNAA